MRKWLAVGTGGCSVPGLSGKPSPLWSGMPTKGDRRGGKVAQTGLRGRRRGSKFRLDLIDIDRGTGYDGNIYILIDGKRRCRHGRMVEQRTDPRRRTGVCQPLCTGTRSRPCTHGRAAFHPGGAACAAHSAAPSHVYTAMGLSPEEASCVLRFSPGRGTTKEEILAAADALIGLYQKK